MGGHRIAGRGASEANPLTTMSAHQGVITGARPKALDREKVSLLPRHVRPAGRPKGHGYGMTYEAKEDWEAKSKRPGSGISGLEAIP